MSNSVSLAIAFLAGVVSFLSPCVLPIIPGFLAYLAGSTIKGGKRAEVFLNSFFFVLGFSAVFTVLGILLNTALSGLAYTSQAWLSRIGGAIIIFFGLYLTGLLKLQFLERDHKLSVKSKFNSRYATSFIFGAAFAAGWTPCVGAVLASIIGLAASQPGLALPLLFAYSLGLGVPFLVVGLFAAQASGWLQEHAESLRYVTVVFGVLLIIVGILVFTQKISAIGDFSLISRILTK